VFGVEGQIVRCDISGAIVMKSFLTGKPELRLGLNEEIIFAKQKGDVPFRAIVLDSCNFATFVNSKDFMSKKEISLVPPVGEFVAMNYRYKKEFEPPIKIFQKLNKLEYKFEYIVRIRSEYPKLLHASSVKIRIPLPYNTSSASVEFGVGSTSVSEYKGSDNIVLWEIEKLWGQSEEVMKLTASFTSPITDIAIEKQIGPISLQFEIPRYNISGVEVKFLDIKERTRDYNPKKWVRSLTRAGSYIARTH
jgi:AP-4 complex subunit mu-1